MPAEVLVRGLGLSQAQSRQVVEARERLGRFQHTQDLINLAGLEPAVYDWVSNRVILM